MNLCEDCSADIRYCGHNISLQISKVKHSIKHRCDGPVTCFVLISRAAKLAAKGEFTAEAVANGLSECLTEFGYLSKAGIDHNDYSEAAIINSAD